MIIITDLYSVDCGLIPHEGSKVFNFEYKIGFYIFIYKSKNYMEKWNDKEISSLIFLLKENKTNSEISKCLNRSFSSIRNKIIKDKLSEYRTTKILDIIEIKCLNCGNIIDTKNKNRKFCDHKCSALYNNKKREHRVYDKIKVSLIKYNSIDYKPTYSLCLNCNKEIRTSPSILRKYCCQKCQKQYEKQIIFDKIENGDTALNYRRYKSYLIHKYGAKCMECGWERINPYSLTIPVEMEHIDGNYNNNSLNNLKLLCPSCHSLTKTYKGANIGNGRHNRRQRYKEGKSY